MLEKGKKYGSIALLLGMLCVYIAAVLVVNFSLDPAYYDTDMYADVQFAREAWEQKALFPEGWVFGNQFYVVATPVLAALFCAVAENPCIAMALASSLMTAGILLSFDWMIKRITREPVVRLTGLVSLLGLVLYFGGPVYELKGWQLLFTMCSYYSCYAITAFLAFGCFIRRKEKGNPGFYVILGITCLLSFGTGIQSLRQTAVMTCPMIAVEALDLLVRALRKKPFLKRPVMVTMAIVLSNLAGFAVSKVVDVPSISIFGDTLLQSVPEMLRSLLPSAYTAASLLYGSHGWIDLAVKAVLVVGSLLLLWGYLTGKEEQAGECGLLFLAGLAVMLVIDVCTRMEVRDIYYFMMYPLTAFLLGMILLRGGNVGKYFCLLVLTAVFAVNISQRLPQSLEQPGRQTVYHSVSDYLEEEGYRTVYSRWNCGQRIAVASDCRIRAGFWHGGTFIPSGYLCSLEVFEEDAAYCVYVFQGEQDHTMGTEAAREYGKEMELLKYFPEEEIYIYTAEKNLMQ